MKWLQIKGYPGYLVNKKCEVKGKNGGLLSGRHVTLRRKGRRQLSITRKRLYLLAASGLDPYLAVGSGVDVVELDGQLRLLDWKERRRKSAVKQAGDMVLSKDESKKRYMDTVMWAEACMLAIEGDTSRLWRVLEGVIPKIDKYLMFQCGESSQVVRREITHETLALYVERVVNGRTTTCSLRALLRMAKGGLAQFNSFVKSNVGRITY